MTDNTVFDVFPWSGNFETGIAQIDEQHRRLVTLINRLASLLSQGADPAALEAVFGELADYAAFHFQSEEALWQSCLEGDGWLQAHRQTHALFLPRVLELKAGQQSASTEEVLARVLKFLVNWLVFHILDSDRRMAKVLAARAAGLPLEAAKQRADEEMAGLMQTFVETIMEMYENLTARSLELIREKNQRLHAERALMEAEHHKQLSEQLMGTMEQLVGAMSSTIEVRSPYTAGHQRRVAALAGAIAADMGLPAGEARGVFLAALIHDMGDIQVPAEFLVRSGPLSPLEFKFIQSHAVAAYDILKDIDFPFPIAQMIRQHHERLDGSGYPDRLRGEQIIPGARIIAVADVVEAMSSHRPYRPALGVDAALAEIQAHRGSKFDPAVVDSCVRLFREKGFGFPPAAGGAKQA